MDRASSVVVVCALIAGCASGEPPPAHEPDGWLDGIALADAIDRDPDPNVVEVDLDARPSTIAYLNGVATNVWTYGGTTPGPTIRAKKGDRVIVHVTNHLPDDTIVHFHGVRLPNAMDGSELTQAPIKPGETFTYDFVAVDAATYWYHAHYKASEEVERGLYGAFVVTDPSELGGFDEAVMMLDDVWLTTDGQLEPPDMGGQLQDYFGREGNVLLVNGRPSPTIHVRRGVTARLRLINAANARFFEVAIDGSTMVRIGGDQGLLEAPLALDRILLAPAERADVLFTPTAETGATLQATWLPFDHGNGSNLESPMPYFQMIVDGIDPVVAPSPPAHLRTIAPIDTSHAKTATITLTQSANAGGPILGVDGKSPDPDPLETKVGETWVYTIDNQTDGDHPFHLHGFPFQPLEVDGVPVAFREWKDTFDVPHRKKAKIAVTFDDRPGMWMFHCHILEHQKLGMMGMIELKP